MLTRILVALGFILFALPTPAAESWVCPMHCEGAKTYPRPGDCPVCGMPLEREGEPAAPPLNTRDYRVDLSVDPKPPVAGKPATLTLVPRLTRDGSTVRLEPTRGQWMLVTAVARDLRFASRVRPEKQADGSVKVNFTFPSGGEYTLYADFRPHGGPGQVFPLSITVKGKEGAAAPLDETGRLRKLADGYRVAMKTRPGVLDFTVTRAGRPAALGAAECLTVSEDTTQYYRVDAKKRAGGYRCPSHLHRSGLYATWLRFSAGGKPHTAAFAQRIGSALGR